MFFPEFPTEIRIRDPELKVLQPSCEFRSQKMLSGTHRYIFATMRYDLFFGCLKNEVRAETFPK